jgi:hypothetical protein
MVLPIEQCCIRIGEARSASFVTVKAWCSQRSAVWPPPVDAVAPGLGHAPNGRGQFDPALMLAVRRFAFDAIELQVCVDCHGCLRCGDWASSQNWRRGKLVVVNCRVLSDQWMVADRWPIGSRNYRSGRQRILPFSSSRSYASSGNCSSQLVQSTTGSVGDDSRPLFVCLNGFSIAISGQSVSPAPTSYSYFPRSDGWT